MLSQMEEAEQRRLRACGLDYIGLLIPNHYKSTFFVFGYSFLWTRMLITPICGNLESADAGVLLII